MSLTECISCGLCIVFVAYCGYVLFKSKKNEN